MKLHLLVERDALGSPHGCSHIRLLRPLSHPSVQRGIEISTGAFDADTSADVVIVERFWDQELSMAKAEALVGGVRQSGAKLLHTMDDNLLDLNLEEPWKKLPSDEARMALRYFLREADGVIVSTPPLAERVSRLNGNVVVVPNQLDERLFGDPCASPSSIAADGKPRRGITIGYMGTATHDRDLLMIAEALREVLWKRRGEARFEIVGGAADARVLRVLEGLPVKVLNTSGRHEYPEFTRWSAENMNWDLAIAPLADTPLNRCKSDLKFLDYGVLGIPGIFSNVQAYRSTVRHMQTGWLCEDDIESWNRALEHMLADEALRRKLAERAREYVCSARTLKQRATDWVVAVEELTTGL